MLARFFMFLCAALPMNLAGACVEHQLLGNNTPTFLAERFLPLWTLAGLLQPWFVFVPIYTYPSAVVASLLTAAVYSALWLLLRRWAFSRAWALRVRPLHLALASAAVALPYLALFAYALYVERRWSPPEPPA